MTDTKVVYQKFAGRGVQKFDNLRWCLCSDVNDKNRRVFRSGLQNNLFRDGEKTVLLENNLKLTGHTIPLVEKHLAKARITWTNSNQSVLMSHRLCRKDKVRYHFKAHVWPARKRFHFFIGSGRRLWQHIQVNTVNISRISVGYDWNSNILDSTFMEIIIGTKEFIVLSRILN